MLADIELANRLQSLDRRISELNTEIGALPRHIAEIEKVLDSHLRRLETDKAALAANNKDRKRLEEDIKTHEQKISKLRDQTLQAKTNEQYRAFQNEIHYFEGEIRKAEDHILDLMSESEPLEANVKKAEEALAKEKKQVEAEKASARERTAADRKQLEELTGERNGLVSGLKPQVYSAYERIRQKRGGRAVAEVVDGRCSACQIALRPQFFQDLRKGEQLMFCESCGRILFYNPPVSFEEDLHAPAHP